MVLKVSVDSIRERRLSFVSNPCHRPLIPDRENVTTLLLNCDFTLLGIIYIQSLIDSGSDTVDCLLVKPGEWHWPKNVFPYCPRFNIVDCIIYITGNHSLVS